MTYEADIDGVTYYCSEADAEIIVRKYDTSFNYSYGSQNATWEDWEYEVVSIEVERLFRLSPDGDEEQVTDEREIERFKVFISNSPREVLQKIWERQREY